MNTLKFMKETSWECTWGLAPTSNAVRYIAGRLKSVNSITNQELYDRVCMHLMKQGRPAVESRGDAKVCRYRTKDGLKCAIGCLITDEYYRPSLEGRTLFSMDVEKSVEKSLGIELTEDQYAFLKDVQNAHDAWGLGLSATFQLTDDQKEHYGVQ